MLQKSVLRYNINMIDVYALCRSENYAIFRAWHGCLKQFHFKDNDYNVLGQDNIVCVVNIQIHGTWLTSYAPTYP